MKRSALTALFLVCAGLLYGQSPRVPVKDLDLRVSLSLENEQYRQDKPISLSIEVCNLSDEPARFLTSPYKMNSFRVIVQDLATAEILPEIYAKTVADNKLKESRPEYFDFNETRLYSDEIYKVRINLQDYFQFPQPGRYKVSVVFDPFPEDKAAHRKFTSAALFLVILDPVPVQEYKELVLSLKQQEEEKAYTPEGMISFLLESYKDRDWESYFLYQDISKVIQGYNQFKDRYNRSAPAMRSAIEQEFRTWIQNRPEMEIEEYKILNVDRSYTAETAVVICKVVYKKPAVERTFNYRYTLRHEGVKWILEDIFAINYSTEKRYNNP